MKIRRWKLIGFLCPLILVLSALGNAKKTAETKHIMPVYPPLLKEGDKVAIVAPTFWHPDVEKMIDGAVQILQSWGLKVVLGEYVEERYYKFAGEDALRIKDLQWALDDPTIKAVFALRGGYGTTRIIDQLDFTHFKENPKWLVGFSDITTLLMKTHQLGVVSAHGEMPIHFIEPRYASSIASLKTLLFEGTAQLSAQPATQNRLGTVTAPVVGGNLTLICSNMETSSALEVNNKILVIEDIGGELYQLDRVMMQLKRAGKLCHLAGLVVGEMVAMNDDPNNPFGKSANEIIKEHVAGYHYPVAFNFPIGHAAPNLAFPHGSLGQLCVRENKASLTFTR